MDDVTVQELRNRGGDVLDRVERGESVLITRAGTAVGELRPVPRRRLNARALLVRWRAVPVVDAAALRADVDAVLAPLR